MYVGVVVVHQPNAGVLGYMSVILDALPFCKNLVPYLHVHVSVHVNKVELKACTMKMAVYVI